MSYRRIACWVVMAGACLAAAASLPPTHAARAWLIVPAVLPLLLAAGWLFAATLTLWIAVPWQGWPRKYPAAGSRCRRR